MARVEDTIKARKQLKARLLRWVWSQPSDQINRGRLHLDQQVPEQVFQRFQQVWWRIEQEILNRPTVRAWNHIFDQVQEDTRDP